MRGKAWADTGPGSSGRITPAYAGKSASSAHDKLGRKDHPRVCGEKAFRCFGFRSRVGSPPRMRGKEAVLTENVHRLGITPAYAGKSCRIRKSRRSEWDHPRVCGEKRSNDNITQTPQGSPPRMRGKVDDIPNFQSRLGITPAYAGKRHRRRDHQRLTQDHPRVCGEKTKKIP